MLITRTAAQAWYLLAILAVILFSAPVAASEDMLTLVPKDALGFVVVNRLSDVSEKLGKLSRDLELPLPDLLTMLKMKLGVTEGLDEKGHLLLALLPPREGERTPQPLAALPVVNYEKLLGSFHGDPSAAISQTEVAGQTILIAEKGAYAVMVNPESRAALKELLDGEATHPAEVESFAQWIGVQDGAVVILNPGLKLAVQQALQGLEEARTKQFEGLDLDGGKSEQVAAALDMYIQMLRIVEAEVRTAAKGLRIDAAGNFLFTGRVRFTESGRLADLASVTKAGKTDLLAGLPGGPYVGAFSAAWSSAYSEVLARWSVSMMKYNPALGGMKLSEDEAQEYAKASILSMQGLRRMAMLMTPGAEDEKLLENFIGVFDVVDADKYLVNYEKAMQAWQKLMGKSESLIPMKMEARETTINGLKGLKISMDMKSLMDAQGAPPEAARMIDRMFGQGGKMTVHVLAADEHTILLSYAPGESIERKVASYQKSKTRLADEPGVARIASLLSQSPDMVAYLSPRGAVAWFKRLWGAMLPPGVDTPEIADFPETPPVGFTANTVAGGLEAKWVVPAELPKAIKEFVQRTQR